MDAHVLPTWMSLSLHQIHYKGFKLQNIDACKESSSFKSRKQKNGTKPNSQSFSPSPIFNLQVCPERCYRLLSHLLAPLHAVYLQFEDWIQNYHHSLLPVSSCQVRDAGLLSLSSPCPSCGPQRLQIYLWVSAPELSDCRRLHRTRNSVENPKSERCREHNKFTMKSRVNETRSWYSSCPLKPFS